MFLFRKMKLLKRPLFPPSDDADELPVKDFQVKRIRNFFPKLGLTY